MLAGDHGNKAMLSAPVLERKPYMAVPGQEFTRKGRPIGFFTLESFNSAVDTKPRLPS